MIQSENEKKEVYSKEFSLFQYLVVFPELALLVINNIRKSIYEKSYSVWRIFRKF
jgi:hypothetical protein